MKWQHSEWIEVSEIRVTFLNIKCKGHNEWIDLVALDICMSWLF